MKVAIIDANNVIARNFYAMPAMTSDGQATGATYGFFRDVLKFTEWWEPDVFAFCFDVGAPLRRKLLPCYKAKTAPRYDSEFKLKDTAMLRKQLDAIRLDLLTRIGFRNVFWSEGYEADDMVATTVASLKPDDHAIVVSSDRDLLQLLAGNVVIYDIGKKRNVTLAEFDGEYGIPPKDWAKVKALAGCKSDNVNGIFGVGELYAAQYVAKTLSPKTKAYKSIASSRAVLERNLPLVTLPFEGCPTPKLRKDRVDRAEWLKVMKELGITKLAGML